LNISLLTLSLLSHSFLKILILYFDIDFVSFHKAFHTSVTYIIKYVLSFIYLTFNHRSILQLNVSCEVYYVTGTLGIHVSALCVSGCHIQDHKLKHMADLQQSVVSDPETKQQINNQIVQWEENLERLHCEQFRLRCYMASLQSGELPNPKVRQAWL
jgi:hypothetical protein